MKQTFLACIALSMVAVSQGAIELAPACAAGKGHQGISEHAFVPIGGIEQWISIEGADCANPVVLLVHGGPGNPVSPYLKSLYGAWQKDFTVVTWDQRLSGRTYGRHEPSTELSVERFHATELSIPLLVRDGIEVSEYIRQRLGKSRLILNGSSWGSVLGVHMAHARPDLFHAYVGVAQLVNARQNLAESYAATLERAQRDGDTANLEILQGLQAPPWKNPRNFGKLRRVIRSYEAAATGPAPATDMAPLYTSADERAAYLAGEEISFLKYVGLEGDGMAAQVNLPALGSSFKLPMYFVQGEEDLLTRPEVTRAYFESIDAPRKKYIAVAKAGHDPNFALLDAQLRVLIDEVVANIAPR